MNMNETQNDTPAADDQFDFIMKDPPKQKKALLPKGNSKTQRIIIIVGAGLAVLTLFIVVFSLIFGASGSGLDNLEKTAQEQQEIIRITEIGEKSARSSATQSLAVSTKLSVASSQQDIIIYLEGKDRKMNGKKLAANLNSKTDASLTTAANNAKFDEVFTTTLIQQLTQYRKNLSKYYDATGNKQQRQLLQEAYKQADDILKREAPSANSDTQ